MAVASFTALSATSFAASVSVLHAGLPAAIPAVFPATCSALLCTVLPMVLPMVLRTVLPTALPGVSAWLVCRGGVAGRGGVVGCRESDASTPLMECIEGSVSPLDDIGLTAYIDDWFIEGSDIHAASKAGEDDAEEAEEDDEEDARAASHSLVNPPYPPSTVLPPFCSRRGITCIIFPTSLPPFVNPL